MRAKLRGHLSLLVVVASAAAVLVIAPAAVAGGTTCVGTNAGAYDNVVVQPGTTCVLNGATVTGNIKALEGSRLLFRNSTIAGNIEGEKATAVQVFQSTVGGNITITDAGPLPAGFPLFSCSIGVFTPCEAMVWQSTVAGNIAVVRTLGTTAINASMVGGNVKIEETQPSPSGEFTDIEGTVIAGNLQMNNNAGVGIKLIRAVTVHGNMQCFGNSAPFISVVNLATKAEGQCTAAPLPLSLSLLTSATDPVAPADPVAVALQQD